MRESVVRISSHHEGNRTFGTGFVVHVDTNGVYIVTCQHVVDDVSVPMVQNIVAEVLTDDETGIDLAVLFVPSLQLKALPLQVEECHSLEVDVIGFSVFNHKTVTQKKHIDAQLFEKSIDLFPEGKLSYKARQIKANSTFNFYSGNSGSPVICKMSKQVIAVISNKEGKGIAYAVDIVNLKRVWKDMPLHLLTPIENISGFLSEVKQPLIKRIPVRKYAFYAIFMLFTFGVFQLFLAKSEENSLVDLQLKVRYLRADWEGVKTHKYPKIAKENLQDKAKILTVALEQIEDAYLINKSKILKYEKLSYAYGIAAHMSKKGSRKRLVLAHQTIKFSDIALEKIANFKDKSWRAQNHIEDKVNVMKMLGYAISIEEGKLMLLPKAKELFEEIEEWYHKDEIIDKSIDVINAFEKKYFNDSPQTSS